MKKLLIVLFSALALTACQTTPNTTKPTPAEVASRVCPALNATTDVLLASPSVSVKAKEEIALGVPLVHALCAPGAITDTADFTSIANITLPALMNAVSGSTFSDTDKNNLLLALALVQIAVNTVRY